MMLISAASWKKYGSYALCAFLTSLVWYFVDLNNKSNTTSKAEYKESILYERGRADRAEAENKELTKALLIKNGIINEIKKNTETTYDKTVGREIK